MVQVTDFLRWRLAMGKLILTCGEGFAGGTGVHREVQELSAEGAETGAAIEQNEILHYARRPANAGLLASFRMTMWLG
jgi:hypothetical protein